MYLFMSPITTVFFFFHRILYIWLQWLYTMHVPIQTTTIVKLHKPFTMNDVPQPAHPLAIFLARWQKLELWVKNVWTPALLWLGLSQLFSNILELAF